MGDIQCEKCGYVDADYKFIHLSEYVGDADLQCHSCGGIICGLEADWQARCLAAEAERDALTAELTTVKAALPRWRLQDGWTGGRGQCWRLGYVGVTDVGYNVFTVSYDHDTATLEEYRSGDYAAARRRAEALLGLPPCEVCDE